MGDDSGFQSHKETYTAFVRLVFYSTVAVVATLVFLAVVLL